MSISEHLQETYLGQYMELFDLDLTRLGGSIYHYVSGTISNQPIQFNGEVYIPIPVEFKGGELSSVGQEPTPTIKFSNVDRILMNEILQLGDLVGGIVTRHRTFSQFLDAPQGDGSNLALPPDQYIVKKNTRLGPTDIEYGLMTKLDDENAMLPNRQVLVDEYQARDGETYSFPGVSRKGSRRSY